MTETQRVHIEPGIYKHFKGNLYFILGLAWSRENPASFGMAEVIYHPLHECENLGWRRDIGLQEFLENVDRPELNYSGPRFVKVLDWKLPNILPGTVFSDSYCNRGKLFIITRCFLAESKIFVVECLHGGQIHNFDIGYIKTHCVIQD